VEKFNEMWRATWNVGSLYGEGAMNEPVKEIDKYKIDICYARNLMPRERNCDNKEMYDFIQWT
jgi:hypothetical protein